jgi:beta-phosphoglucomutase
MRVSDSRKGVVFDLDGVLVDTGWAHRQSWLDLAEKEGFDMSEEFFRGTFGMQSPEVLATLLGPGQPTEELKSMAQWKEARYRELIVDKLKPAEGVGDLLDALKSERYLMAVGSSTPRVNVMFLIEGLGLRNYFDAYVAEEDVNKGKPDPQTFLKAAEKLLLAPNRCVVVEDAVQGVEAGKAAGMSVVAVTTTRNRGDLVKADVVVDSLAELKVRDFAELIAQ